MVFMLSECKKSPKRFFLAITYFNNTIISHVALKGEHKCLYVDIFGLSENKAEHVQSRTAVGNTAICKSVQKHTKKQRCYQI